MTGALKGRIHSFQSMGTLDGPGVRYVVFMQGCNLRCKCCHNPDTWDPSAGKEYTAQEVADKMLHFKEYFGSQGGITVSGGEPLIQSQFVQALFEISHQNNVNTCLDTSGSILNDDVKKLLSCTDRVLLDIKYTNDNLYIDNVGCSLLNPIDFLKYLDDKSIHTTLRQVIIPGLNDTEGNVIKLKQLGQNHTCVDKIELLPFRKICLSKYDNMNIDFPFANIPEPSFEKMESLKSIINS